MTGEVVEAFGREARTYDDARRRLVPPYDRLYAETVGALELSGRALERVIDLGAGTGLLAKQIAAAHPEAAITLLDGAANMLSEARRNLGERAAGYVCADFGDELPSGPWDAVVSALAIHHLPDPGKRELFRRVHEALLPGGLFVNADQVAGPTAMFEEAYGRWHRERAYAAGSSQDEWVACEARMRHDRAASVENQLAWLREAGFADADCLLKDHRFAVLVARRAG